MLIRILIIYEYMFIIMPDYYIKGGGFKIINGGAGVNDIH